MFRYIGQLIIPATFLLRIAYAAGSENRGLRGPVYDFDSKSIDLAKDSYWEDFQGYDDKNQLKTKWITSDFQIRDPSTEDFRAQYSGEWYVEEPYSLKSLNGDRGLVLRKSNVAAMIGSLLPTPISLDSSSNLVVQYEVQLQNELKCGGAFLKLLPLITNDDLAQYDGRSPILELLFGPDMCPPYTDEIHVGIKKTNPTSMMPELKLLKQAPLSQLTDVSVAHLYTLILKGSKKEYEIRVDGSVVKAGNLLDEGAFVPSFNPPRYVPDPEEKKPLDWDDRQYIPDSKVTKPEDWDETEPPQIVDENDARPSDWDESMPEMITDPNRERPEWWDEDNDGVWIAPMVENPECENISGCGEWIPRMIENPKYKGKWEPSMIPNPGYQGVWEAQLIENPNYYEDSAPAKLENPIGGILFEFWSGTPDLVIDNIYIGKHIEEAELLGNATFVPKRKFQDEQLESKLVGNNRQPKVPPSYEEEELTNIYDTAVALVEEYVIKLSEIAVVAPKTLIVTVTTLLLVLLGAKLYS